MKKCSYSTILSSPKGIQHWIPFSCGFVEALVALDSLHSPMILVGLIPLNFPNLIQFLNSYQSLYLDNTEYLGEMVEVSFILTSGNEFEP